MDKFKNCIKKPTFNNKLKIYSDGNYQYENVLPEYFPTDAMDYGQLIKIKKCGKLIEKKKKIIFGNPQIKDIETTAVECHNGIFRGKIARLVRKTKCHSKCKYQLEKHITLFQFYWNFMKPLHGKLSPAMEEGIIHKLWTWGNLLHWQLRVVN